MNRHRIFIWPAVSLWIALAGFFPGSPMGPDAVAAQVTRGAASDTATADTTTLDLRHGLGARFQPVVGIPVIAGGSLDFLERHPPGVNRSFGVPGPAERMGPWEGALVGGIVAFHDPFSRYPTDDGRIMRTIIGALTGGLSGRPISSRDLLRYRNRTGRFMPRNPAFEGLHPTWPPYEPPGPPARLRRPISDGGGETEGAGGQWPSPPWR